MGKNRIKAARFEDLNVNARNLKSIEVCVWIERYSYLVIIYFQLISIKSNNNFIHSLACQEVNIHLLGVSTLNTHMYVYFAIVRISRSVYLVNIPNFEMKLSCKHHRYYFISNYITNACLVEA